MVWFDVHLSDGHDVHLSDGHNVHLSDGHCCNLVAVHNLPDWAVAVLHRFVALPDNFLETGEISRRSILLPEVFLDTAVSLRRFG